MPGTTRGRATGRVKRTPLTLGLTEGLAVSVGRTEGEVHGCSSVGTHGDSLTVGETDGVVHGLDSVGTHGLGVVHGLDSVGTHGLGEEHGWLSVGTHGDSDPVGDTVGEGVGVVQPVCAGLVFAMPWLPSHS